MNKLAKIGASALCGSLAAIASAQAGEMVVTGGATATYSKGDQTTNGNPIGMNTGLTFTGNGELDNGTTFSMNVVLLDNYELSASTTTITTPSLGSFTLGQSNGSASYMYDEEVPQAYEQVSDGKQTMANLVGNFMDNNVVMYTAPALEFMGATVQAQFVGSGNTENSIHGSDPLWPWRP